MMKIEALSSSTSYPWPGSPKGYDKYPASWLYQAFLNVKGLEAWRRENLYVSGRTKTKERSSDIVNKFSTFSFNLANHMAHDFL